METVQSRLLPYQFDRPDLPVPFLNHSLGAFLQVVEGIPGDAGVETSTSEGLLILLRHIWIGSMKSWDGGRRSHMGRTGHRTRRFGVG